MIELDLGRRFNGGGKPAENDDVPPPPYPDFDWSADFVLAGEVAKLAAKDTEIDPCAVIFSFLATAAALFGIHCYTRAGETRHYPRLFVCIVGSSSRSRKGSSTGLIRRIIATVNEQLSVERHDQAFTVIDGGVLQSLTKNNRIKSTDPHINLITHITGFELRKVLVENEVQTTSAERFIPIDASAETRWAEIYRAVSIDEIGRAAAFTARGEAHILRMALIFALLDCRQAIKVDHLETAYTLWRYADGSVRHTFCSAEGIEGDPDAQKVLNALREHGEMTQTIWLICSTAIKAKRNSINYSPNWRR